MRSDSQAVTVTPDGQVVTELPHPSGSASSPQQPPLWLAKVAQQDQPLCCEQAGLGQNILLL